jgi:integrase
MPRKKHGEEQPKLKKRRRTQIVVGHEADGKPIKKYPSATSLTKLEEKKKELKRRYGAGGPGADAEILMKDYALRWLENKKPEIAPATYASYKSCIDNQIIKTIGNRQVASINLSVAKSCVSACADLSDSTANKVTFILKSIFKDAMVDGIALRDPTLTMKQRSKEPPIRRALTDQEAKALLTCAEKRHDGLIVQLLYYTGLRPGEAYGLQWKHLDMEKKIITVDQQLHVSKDGVKVDRRLKTDNSRRKVPMPDELHTILQRVRGLPDVYVFHTKTGRYYTKTKGRIEWTSLMEAAKTPDITPRYMRHNYATMLYLAGVPVQEAARILGHTVTIMMTVYVNIENELRDVDVEKINNVFKSSVAKTLPSASRETPGL